MRLLQIARAAGTDQAHGNGLPAGSALDWGITLTIALCALILVCIVASRLLYRGQQSEGHALWLHLVALGILPLVLLAFGTFTVLEYAKEERFCGACHLTMKVYIDDLHDPKGKSLAALHFRHRFSRGTECYACHADYGLHGTFEAKLKGLNDVYRYVTRTYRVPLKMHTPFSNGLCLKCHSGATRFVAEEVHLDGEHVSEDLRTGKTPCGECHKPAHQAPKRVARPGGAG